MLVIYIYIMLMIITGLLFSQLKASYMANDFQALSLEHFQGYQFLTFIITTHHYHHHYSSPSLSSSSSSSSLLIIIIIIAIIIITIIVIFAHNHHHHHYFLSPSLLLIVIIIIIIVIIISSSSSIIIIFTSAVYLFTLFTAKPKSCSKPDVHYRLPGEYLSVCLSLDLSIYLSM